MEQRSRTTAEERPRGQTCLLRFALTAGAVMAAGAVQGVLDPDVERLKAVLPIVFTTAIVGAAVSAHLLGVLAETHRRPTLAWIATANWAAAIAMAVQLAGFPGIAVGGGLLGTTGDGAAWLYLVWHLAMPLAVVAGLAGVDLRWRPWFLGAVAAASVGVAWNAVVPIPAVFRPDGRYGSFLVGAMAALSVLGFVALWAWCRRVRSEPVVAEGWILVSLAMHGFDVATHAIAVERFTSLWWLSLGSRLAQFSVLAVGLLVHVANQLRALDRYADAVERTSATSLAEASTDFVTGLANRRGLFEAAAPVLSTSAGAGAVLFVDLDGFKAVNDTLGHDAGDALLGRVGAAICETVRSGDLVARWGGDEFVVVCPDATPALAAAIAERLRGALADVTPGSVGWAVVDPTAGATLAEAIAEADEAMFERKRAARAASTGA